MNPINYGKKGRSISHSKGGERRNTYLKRKKKKL